MTTLSANTARPPREVDHEHPLVQAHQRRNSWLLAWYQIVNRVGWIFKTESVVMPAFLDAIEGSGWLRGCLPALNRLGQSVPPVLYARRLSIMPRKKRSLLSTTMVMAVVFLGLSGLCFAAERWSWLRTGWQAAIALVLYAVFFSTFGLNQMAQATLVGKLLPPDRRGWNLFVGSTLGSAAAVGAAWWLLGWWLARPDGGFAHIFGFTGLCFAAAALFVPPLVEPADRRVEPPGAWSRHFVEAWRILKIDANFRRLAVVGMLFSVGVNLFPHYQKFAFDRFDCPRGDIVTWVIVQNIGVALYSLLAGPVADRRGNRLVLRWLAVLAAAAPLLSVALTFAPREMARDWFWVIFLLLGLTPITFRALANYTLEIAPIVEHPRYLSTLNLCMVVPLLFAPLTGELTSVTSFESVFLSGAALVLLGGMLTFRLTEPRHAAAEVRKLMESAADDSTFPGSTV